jgi:hypothetical protein
LQAGAAAACTAITRLSITVRLRNSRVIWNERAAARATRCVLDQRA